MIRKLRELARIERDTPIERITQIQNDGTFPGVARFISIFTALQLERIATALEKRNDAEQLTPEARAVLARAGYKFKRRDRT